MVKMQWEHVKILEDMKTIYIRYLQDFGIGQQGCVPSYWKFETDGVFYNNTQDEIYDSILSGVLERVTQGCNAVILTYGQTGSGKSLTASGVLNSFKDRGIAPRLITDLFQRKSSLKNQQKMCIQMSYIETNKMYITDLLNPSNVILDAQALKSIKAVKMKDEGTALKTLFKAEGRRQFAKGCLKSHAANGVLTLHVITRPINQTDPVTQVSKIHIVDLAGADTFGNVTSWHKSIFEVGNANLAKTHLEQFVLILCQNNAEQILVKQRLNVLIQYLSDSLNARSILRCIGHIRTDKENLLVTISMLRFGQIIRGLRPQKLQPNVTEDTAVKLNQLQEEIKALQREKDLEVMLTNADLSANINQERIKHMQNVAEEYLQNKTNELVLLNVTDTTTVIKVFKNLYNKLEVEKVECAKVAYEQAYEDALASVKKVPSKTDSIPSAKGSRKGSKSTKSKDYASNTLESKSFTKTPKRSSKISARSRASSASKLPEGKGQSMLGLKSQDRSSTTKLKRTKTSSLNISKRSTASRRKSGSSTATIGGGAHGTILEEMPLPKAVPEYEEVWDLFTNDDDYNYKVLNEIADTSEESAKSAYKNYMEEIKNLQKVQEVIDIRKYELQKAQMLRLLTKEERDDDGNIIISDLEKLCIENFDKAQEELVQQQENVLKNQAEFCITLEFYQNAKNNIKERYEQFCQEKFQTSVPNLPNLSDYVIQKGSEVGLSGEEPESATVIQKCNDIGHYENLQQVMKDQMQKKINEQKRSAKWIQSCKM